MDAPRRSRTSLRDYSRLAATAFSVDRVSALRAVVVGAGALGNEVIKNLALLGVGQLHIIDRDILERSNLTRSVLFAIGEVEVHLEGATPKAELAALRAREINPDVRTRATVAEIADVGLEVLRAADVVFSCLDNELARLELSWACTRTDRLLVDGGLGLFNSSSGMVSVFPGSRGPCYACRKGADKRRELLQELQGRADPCWRKERAEGRDAIVSTTPIMASAVAALQVETGLRGALDQTSGDHGVAHRLTFHPTVSLETSTFLRSPNCVLHDQASIIGDVATHVPKGGGDCRVSDLLSAFAAQALILDWPLTVAAGCTRCGHHWEPMVRRGRFRAARCPQCHAAEPAEIEVLTVVGTDSRWTARTLEGLGLPRHHIHTLAQREGVVHVAIADNGTREQGC